MVYYKTAEEEEELGVAEEEEEREAPSNGRRMRRRRWWWRRGKLLPTDVVERNSVGDFLCVHGWRLSPILNLLCVYCVVLLFESNGHLFAEQTHLYQQINTNDVRRPFYVFCLLCFTAF